MRLDDGQIEVLDDVMAEILKKKNASRTAADCLRHVAFCTKTIVMLLPFAAPGMERRTNRKGGGKEAFSWSSMNFLK